MFTITTPMESATARRCCVRSGRLPEAGQPVPELAEEELFAFLLPAYACAQGLVVAEFQKDDGTELGKSRFSVAFGAEVFQGSSFHCRGVF